MKKKNERCRHPDCLYRVHGEYSKMWQCNYFFMTGQCRTAGLSPEEAKPCNCREYVPEKEKGWEKRALELYDDGATDEQIAEAIGKTFNTVRMWRYGKRLPKNKDRRKERR